VTDSWLFGKRDKILAARRDVVHLRAPGARICSELARGGRAQPWSQSSPSPVSQAAARRFTPGGNAASKLFERSVKPGRERD